MCAPETKSDNIVRAGFLFKCIKWCSICLLSGFSQAPSILRLPLMTLELNLLHLPSNNQTLFARGRLLLNPDILPKQRVDFSAPPGAFLPWFIASWNVFRNLADETCGMFRSILMSTNPILYLKLPQCGNTIPLQTLEWQVYNPMVVTQNCRISHIVWKVDILCLFQMDILMEIWDILCIYLHFAWADRWSAQVLWASGNYSKTFQLTKSSGSLKIANLRWKLWAHSGKMFCGCN